MPTAVVSCGGSIDSDCMSACSGSDTSSSASASSWDANPDMVDIFPIPMIAQLGAAGMQSGTDILPDKSAIPMSDLLVSLASSTTSSSYSLSSSSSSLVTTDGHYASPSVAERRRQKQVSAHWAVQAGFDLYRQLNHLLVQKWLEAQVQRPITVVELQQMLQQRFMHEPWSLRVQYVHQAIELLARPKE